jgi:VWFA-related protein
MSRRARLVVGASLLVAASSRMPRPRLLFALALSGCLTVAATAVAQRGPASSSADLVELDIVALDRGDKPVSDLRQDEFQIKDDGRAVEIKTFDTVSASGVGRRDQGRSVVLLLDDIGIPVTGTFPMRGIAQMMLLPARPADDVSVVRLSNASDEAFGDSQTALARIEGYHGGAVPFARRDSPETALKAIAKVSRTMDITEHRRKVIICVGVSAVCNVEEPRISAGNGLWRPWVEALAAAARANVSVYAVDPTGLTQRSVSRSGGLVQWTGGEVFANSNDFSRAAASIWDEASHYYLAGYWPGTGRRELHSIDVRVARKNVHARVRVVR